MKATIWHNPGCGTSRKTLALLEERGCGVEVVEYLRQPPTKDKLTQLYRDAGMTRHRRRRARSARGLIRRGA